MANERIFKMGAIESKTSSSITGKKYHSEHKKFKSWWKGINDKNMTRKFDNYDKNLNFYKVSCGTTLEFWESMGWITKTDPYGWIQWYCNFTKGRRHNTEDRRQIDRWKKFAGRDQGRFRKNLVTKIIKNNAEYNDYNISPVIRQSLQHWAYQLTKDDFNYEVKQRNKN